MVAVISNLVYYDILLQSATAILLQYPVKVYYKMHQLFITNPTILLQNATFIKKCVGNNH